MYFSSTLLSIRLLATMILFFFSSRRLHTRLQGDWSSDVCSSDLKLEARYRAGVEYYAAQNPRLASFMAAIHVAAELAHQVLELPWCPCDALWTVWNQMAAEGQDAAGEVRALRHVLSWAH